MQMALTSDFSDYIMEEAKRRLRASPDDSLEDLKEKLREHVNGVRDSTMNKIFVAWVLDVLFDHNYKDAKLALAKCRVLNPQNRLGRAEGEELLKTLWSSCRILLGDDWDRVLDEVENRVELAKQAEGGRLCTGL